VNLGALLADTDTRKITREQARPSMPGSTVIVEQRIDGSLHFRWRDQYLQLEPAERSEDCWAAQQRKAEAEVRKKASRKPRPLPPKPPADSPLRRFHPVSKRAAALFREQDQERRKMVG
jgi:hypothetical protein